MDIHNVLFHFLLLVLTSLFLFPILFAQVTPSERRILFQVQHLLEYPSVLQGWTNWTNFCYLPPSASLTIVCSHNHITELTVVANKTSPSTLSERFSIDSFFTILTKLSNLKVLKLISLGIWGSLPAKISRFYSLQVLDISSNPIYGNIPPEIALMTHLHSLVLANSLFNGSVPDLSNLSVLEELDLSRNRLGRVGPQFPSLGKTLVKVVLRSNDFRSYIPSKLNNFDQLQHLDVSWNKLIGPIPSQLFSLPSIQYLNLASNKLSGALSTNVSCSSGLQFIDLSNNYLIGKLPLCSSNRMYYSWNCLSVGNSKYQHPYSFCHKEALAVKPTTRGHKSGSVNKLVIIIIIGAGIIAAIATIGYLLVMFRRLKMDKVGIYTLEKSVSRKSSAQLSPKLPTEARHVSPMMRFGTIGLRTYRVFSLGEIEEATDNFVSSNLTGEGPQGQMYKGCLRDGSTVVVRCIKLKQKHSSQRLLQHMEVLSKLRHLHLVSTLGHCIVTHHDYPSAANTIFLVFEYVSDLTLRNHLTDHRTRNMLKWPQRIAITVGIAKGIQFLHTGIAPGIYGNDVRIENILLDQNLTAKVSNYNLLIPSKGGSESPLNGVKTPEDLGSSMRSSEEGEREDVYQLGAIFLEVITGKPITHQKELEVQKLQLEQSLAESPQILRGMIDPSIRGTYAYESLKTAAEITIYCLCKDPVHRPTIENVIWNLQYSVQVQDGWAISGENLSAKSESSCR